MLWKDFSIHSFIHSCIQPHRCSENLLPGDRDKSWQSNRKEYDKFWMGFPDPEPQNPGYWGTRHCPELQGANAPPTGSSCFFPGIWENTRFSFFLVFFLVKTHVFGRFFSLFRHSSCANSCTLMSVLNLARFMSPRNKIYITFYVPLCRNPKHVAYLQLRARELTFGIETQAF